VARTLTAAAAPDLQPGSPTASKTMPTSTSVVRVAASSVSCGAAAPAAAPGGVASVIGDAMAFVRARGIVDAMPPEVMLRTISAWTALFGTVSFELFGHYVGSVSDSAAYFDQVAARLADGLGFDAEF